MGSKKNILKYAGSLKDELKDFDSKKFIENLRKEDSKNDKKRFAELEKHWKR